MIVPPHFEKIFQAEPAFHMLRQLLKPTSAIAFLPGIVHGASAPVFDGSSFTNWIKTIKIFTKTTCYPQVFCKTPSFTSQPEARGILT
jgi:hypothetical protein